MTSKASTVCAWSEIRFVNKSFAKKIIQKKNLTHFTQKILSIHFTLQHLNNCRNLFAAIPVKTSFDMFIEKKLTSQENVTTTIPYRWKFLMIEK